MSDKISDPLECLMVRHFGLDGQGAYYFADKLAMFAFGTPSHVYDGPKDLAALGKIERALVDLATAFDSMTPAATELLARNMIWGPFIRKVVGSNLPPELRESFVAYCNDKGKPLIGAIDVLRDGLKETRAALGETRREIENSPSTKKSTAKMNLEGIQMVEAARWVWQQVRKEPPPASDINMASPFGRFLSDLFELFEMSGDPRSAFRAWVRENRSPYIPQK